MCFFAAGVPAGVAAGLEAASGVAIVPAAALDFFDCFSTGVADVVGLGLGVGSAARIKVGAAKAARTIRAKRERMKNFLK